MEITPYFCSLTDFFEEATVELNNLSFDAAELRSTIMASSMTSCYLLMDRIAAQDGRDLRYEDFRREWIELFKEVHRLVSRMKPRRKAR